MDVDVLKWFADMHNVIFDARWRLNAMHELTHQMIGVTVSAIEGASRLSGRDNGSALTAGHSKLRRRRCCLIAASRTHVSVARATKGGKNCQYSNLAMGRDVSRFATAQRMRPGSEYKAHYHMPRAFAVRRWQMWKCQSVGCMPNVDKFTPSLPHRRLISACAVNIIVLYNA